ncbi:thiamine pyrophosphate-binding protein, partial [Klebsiella sp. K47]
VRSAETCLSTLEAAVQAAMTAPTGPVSVEIPIDIQQTVIDMPADLSPLPVAVLAPSEASLDALADTLAKARR